MWDFWGSDRRQAVTYLVAVGRVETLSFSLQIYFSTGRNVPFVIKLFSKRPHFEERKKLLVVVDTVANSEKFVSFRLTLFLAPSLTGARTSSLKGATDKACVENSRQAPTRNVFPRPFPSIEYAFNINARNLFRSSGPWPFQPTARHRLSRSLLSR